MLEVKELSFSYGNNVVLEDINLSFHKGHIYGLLGANGSGKSTLLKCLGNLFYQSKGFTTYNGVSIIDNLSYLSKSMFLDSSFYIGNLNTLDLLYNFKTNKDTLYDMNLFNNLLDEFTFNPKIPIKRLSKGNQRLAYLIVTLSLNLEVIILDEFLDGIDIVSRNKLKDIFLDYVIEKNAIVIISSHTTSDIKDLCDRIALLKDKKIKKDCSIDELELSYLTYQLVVKDKLDIDKLKNKGLVVHSYKNFENIYWLSIENVESQIGILDELDFIDKKVTNANLEEVIFNEFI